MTVLQGAQVVLRPFTANDLATVLAFLAHPELVEAWPGDNGARLRAMLEPGADGMAMVVELEGRPIGVIQWYEETDPDYFHASIDIALHADFCNRGLGTDALRTLARHLFEERGHHRITLDPHVNNARAIASYRKLGFKDVGVMRRYERGPDGQWRDSLLMDLLREELT